MHNITFSSGLPLEGPPEISFSESSHSPWYAVKVRTKAEGLVCASLERKGYECYSPSYIECRNYSDRIRKVQAPLFPGYLFCRLDIAKRLPVLMSEGVLYFVSFGDVPQPVDESELDAVRAALGSGLQVQSWPYLRTGDRVRIEAGSMAGVEGVLLKSQGVDRLIISVHLLQRSLSLQIDRTWIRPLAGSAINYPPIAKLSRGTKSASTLEVAGF